MPGHLTLETMSEDAAAAVKRLSEVAGVSEPDLVATRLASLAAASVAGPSSRLAAVGARGGRQTVLPGSHPFAADPRCQTWRAAIGSGSRGRVRVPRVARHRRVLGRSHAAGLGHRQAPGGARRRWCRLDPPTGTRAPSCAETSNPRLQIFDDAGRKAEAQPLEFEEAWWFHQDVNLLRPEEGTLLDEALVDTDPRMAHGVGRMSAETPVLFDVGESQLFGMVTHPETPNGVGVMIIQGGDTVNVSLQRNRLAVRMARELAERGYTCLRFDYHGLGESTGTIGELRLEHARSPKTPRRQPACCGNKQGVDHLVLAGACFSSRTALSTAPLLDDVSAVVMATPPIGSYERTEAVAERMTRDRTIGEYASLATAGKDDQVARRPDSPGFLLQARQDEASPVERPGRPGQGRRPVQLGQPPASRATRRHGPTQRSRS